MSGWMAPSEEVQPNPRPRRIRQEEPSSPLHTPHGHDGLPGKDAGEQREEAPKRLRPAPTSSNYMATLTVTNHRKSAPALTTASMKSNLASPLRNMSRNSVAAFVLIPKCNR
jgi:hypothetical protein